MSTRLASTRTELAALRALCSPRRQVAGIILAGTDSSYFYNESAVEAYNKIRHTITKEGEAPAWTALVDDPTLSEDTRDFLQQAEPVLKTTKDADHSVAVLNKYRQLRGAYLLAEDILTKLQSKKIDTNTLIEGIADAFAQVRATKSVEDLAIHFGSNNNSLDIIRRILDEKREQNFLPTGFRDFDIKNGGILFKTLMVVAGTSGGGKCLRFSTNLLEVKSVKVRLKDGTVRQVTPEAWARVLEARAQNRNQENL